MNQPTKNPPEPKKTKPNMKNSVVDQKMKPENF